MKITCGLPNASDNINGIPFEPLLEGGMVSVDDVPDDQAAIMLSVPGFAEFIEPEQAPAKRGKKKADPDPDASTAGSDAGGADGAATQQ